MNGRLGFVISPCSLMFNWASQGFLTMNMSRVTTHEVCGSMLARKGIIAENVPKLVMPTNVTSLTLETNFANHRNGRALYRACLGYDGYCPI